MADNSQTTNRFMQGLTLAWLSLPLLLIVYIACDIYRVGGIIAVLLMFGAPVIVLGSFFLWGFVLMKLFDATDKTEPRKMVEGDL